MRHPTWYCAAGAIILFLAISGCETPAPYLLALYERQSFRVDLLSWSPGEERITFEVEIEGTPRRLDHLTVLVTQHGPDDVELRSDRVTLALDGIEVTGVKQMFGLVPAGEVMPVGLAIQVEGEPPIEALAEFPELAPFLPASGIPPTAGD